MPDLEQLCSNAVDVISKEELANRLKENRPLRIKAGFDPSAPDIHLGHTVLLRKLRQFQDAGHKVILLIGGFTAMIGDPTGKTTTRPALSYDEVKKNAETYQKQAFKILDKDSKKIEVVNNYDWLGKLSLQQFFGEIASKFTVAQILEREDFDKRMSSNQPISLREFMYPLLQAYDSVVIKADVELGGTDQKFNLLAGRDLQRSYGQPAQVVMTFPLLVGLDGTNKMSKSLGNYIAVNDSAKDVFGKAMSIPDTLMASYYSLLTDEPGSKVSEAIESKRLHPRDAKVNLAKLLTQFLHGSAAAEAEASEFDRVFSKKETPDNPDELQISEKEIWIVELLKRAGAATSTSEARRLIEQGAVSIDGAKVSDFNQKIQVVKGSLLKAGKKKFVKLT